MSAMSAANCRRRDAQPLIHTVRGLGYMLKHEAAPS